MLKLNNMNFINTMVLKQFEYRVRDTYRQIHYRELWKLMLHSHSMLSKDKDLRTVCGQIKGYMTKYGSFGKFNSHRIIFNQMIGGLNGGGKKEIVLKKYKIAILNKI
tara:strand:- start:3064 stop:3384 length:321 start_codon:yes stop_codon:yes gene_type:complete